MSHRQTITGKCLCGAVRFTAETVSHDVTVCHCTMCNRWSGGLSLFLDTVGVPNFEGAESIGVYKSSDWGERGFCKVCGSSLYWKYVDEDRYTMSAGVIDDPAQLQLTKEIFIDDKPAYYAFANETVKQTAEEVLAASRAPGSKD